MRAYRRAAGVLSVLALLGSACQELPTTVQSSDPREPFDGETAGPRVAASHEPPDGPNQFWCTYTLDPTGSRHEYRLGIHFSDRTLDPRGRTRSYTYVIQDAGRPPLATYSCEIPRTEAAIQAVGRLLGIPEASRHGNAPPDAGGFGDPAAFKGEARRRLLFGTKGPGKPRFDTTCSWDVNYGWQCYMDGVTVYGGTSGGGGGGMDGDYDSADAYWDYTSGGGGSGSSTSWTTLPPGMEPGYWASLNATEKQMCWASLSDCWAVKSAADDALAWAARVEPIGAHNGPQDALRHAKWNANMTRVMGAQRAKAWADAHEKSSTDPAETRMDLFNNAVGRDIGSTWSNPAAGVIWARDNGKLCLARYRC
jgi:hypothetical protein